MSSKFLTLLMSIFLGSPSQEMFTVTPINNISIEFHFFLKNGKMITLSSRDKSDIEDIQMLHYKEVKKVTFSMFYHNGRVTKEMYHHVAIDKASAFLEALIVQASSFHYSERTLETKSKSFTLGMKALDAHDTLIYDEAKLHTKVMKSVKAYQINSERLFESLIGFQEHYAKALESLEEKDNYSILEDSSLKQALKEHDHLKQNTIVDAFLQAQYSYVLWQEHPKQRVLQQLIENDFHLYEIQSLEKLLLGMHLTLMSEAFYKEALDELFYTYIEHAENEIIAKKVLHRFISFNTKYVSETYSQKDNERFIKSLSDLSPSDTSKELLQETIQEFKDINLAYNKESSNYKDQGEKEIAILMAEKLLVRMIEKMDAYEISEIQLHHDVLKSVDIKSIDFTIFTKLFEHLILGDQRYFRPNTESLFETITDHDAIRFENFLLERMKNSKDFRLPTETFFSDLLKMQGHREGPRYDLILLVKGQLEGKKRDNVLLEIKEQKAEKKRREAKEKQDEIKSYLKWYFKQSMADKRTIDDYIQNSESLIKKAQTPKELSYYFAAYTTKLMIHVLSKSDLQTSKKLFQSYHDNIIAKTGFDKKSYDVASMGLLTALHLKDTLMIKQVFKGILGPDFKISDSDNEIFLFNLSCYYAQNKKKKEMLEAIHYAILHGKTKEQFLTDGDFDTYLKDKDFLEVFKNSRTIDLIDIDNLHFEVTLELASGKKINLNNKYENIADIEDVFAWYELIDPVNITLSILGVNKNKTYTLVENIPIDDIESFLQELNDNININVGSEFRTKPISDKFIFALKREDKTKLLLYNYKHQVHSKLGIYDEYFRINYMSYAQALYDISGHYETIMQSLYQKIQAYLHPSQPDNQRDGLELHYTGQRLFHEKQKEYHFTFSLKNITQKSISLIDNFKKKVHASKGSVDIALDSRPKKDAKILEIKAGESMDFKELLSNTGLIDTIELSISLQNTYSMRNYMAPKDSQDSLDASMYKHTFRWGYFQEKVTLFTLKKDWQKDMQTSKTFDEYISTFKRVDFN